MADYTLLDTHVSSSESDFLMYTGDYCGYCDAAKRLLKQKNLTVTEYNFDEGPPEMRDEISSLTNHRTVPVIFDLRYEKPLFIGGFTELREYLK